MSEDIAAAYYAGRDDERKKDKEALRNALRERDEARAQVQTLRAAASDAYAVYESWGLTGDGTQDLRVAMERLHRTEEQAGEALAVGEDDT